MNDGRIRMKILFYQWEAFMQRDMELVLQKMGIEYSVYRFPFKEKNDPEQLKEAVDRKLREDSYDAVLSFNYRTEVATSANEVGIPYIAWIVDSPFGVTQDEEVLRLSTNYIFVFDGYDYQRLKERGINTVYHHALAVNYERLERLQLSAADHQRFDAEVSFVGALYPSTFVGFRNRLSEDQANWVEAVIAKQSAVQGRYLLSDLTSDEEVLKDLQLTLDGEYHGHDHLFHEGLQSILAKEITRRDRLMMLMFLSEFHQVALYSNKSDALLQKVDERGIVDSFEELFKVYKCSKINLCMTYRRIPTGIPLRAFEVMGAGGFLLSNWQEELVEAFTPGTDIEVYESLEEAADKVAYYLEHEGERARIAAQGRESVGRFSYENQFSKMLDIVFH